MNHDDLELDDHQLSGQHAIDALLDGEAVDKSALRAALADAGARDYLIDTLMLRHLTREMGPRHFTVPAKPRGVIGRHVRWMAAGLVLMTSAASGYVYGQRTRPAAPENAVATAADTRPAPEPTQVIRFEPGVNWTNPNWSH